MDSRRVAELFGIANGLAGATERRRRIAVKQLLREYRLQIGRFQKTGRIDPFLVQGIEDWGRKILSKANPVMALQELLGAREKRGKRAKNTERDFGIAVAVVREMSSGLSLERASEAVAANYQLEPDSVAKIYKRNHIEAKAHVAMAKFEANSQFDAENGN
jgi:hypothetical protein